MKNNKTKAVSENKIRNHPRPDPARPGPPGRVAPTPGARGPSPILTADGSVKFLKNTVAIQTYWGLGIREGGEIISSDAYRARPA